MRSILLFCLLASACTQRELAETAVSLAINPVIITDSVPHDSDDPAIWINYANPAESLVVGTDKNENGGLYVFDLKGKIDHKRSVKGLQRPNNVDIEYGLMLQGKPVDIVVTTERMTHKLRIYSLPDMQPIDGGGIPVFDGETGVMYRDLMGVALYKNRDGEIFVITGRKTGPTDGSYLWQYKLTDNGNGIVAASLVRKFGNYSGFHEIEAIAVDDALGYIYYSDEGKGVRKYYADPEKGNEELAFFAKRGFSEDHEGISIYPSTDSTGYIIVSDQGSKRFHIFKREGEENNRHDHRLVKIVKVKATQSDGSEITAYPLNEQFKKGIFVVMSDDRTFHYYRPEDFLP